MSCERKVTKDTTKQEKEAIQSECVNEIERNVSTEVAIKQEIVATQSTQCNSDVVVLLSLLLRDILPENDRENSSQSSTELEEKTLQVQEQTARPMGTIKDVETQIKRLNGNKRHKIRPEDLEILKEKFQELYVHNKELRGLIETLFPKSTKRIKEVLEDLVMEKHKVGSTGYIPITAQNFKIMELLKDMNIVTINPDNNREMKLAPRD